jgi:hypothetical protein
MTASGYLRGFRKNKTQQQAATMPNTTASKYKSSICEPPMRRGV